MQIQQYICIKICINQSIKGGKNISTTLYSASASGVNELVKSLNDAERTTKTLELAISGSINIILSKVNELSNSIIKACNAEIVKNASKEIMASMEGTSKAITESIKINKQYIDTREKDNCTETLSAALREKSAANEKLLTAAKETGISVSENGLLLNKDNIKLSQEEALALYESVGATTAKTFITTAYTAASGLATVATKIFSAALKALPFVAIGAAIGAVIGLIGKLVSKMTEESAESKKLKEDIENLDKAYKELAEQIENSRNKYNEKIAAIDREKEANQKLIDNIVMLTKGYDGSAEQLSVLTGYIQMANEAVDGLNLSFDEESGKLTLNGELLDDNSNILSDYINSLGGMDKGIALQERYNELTIEMLKLLEDKNFQVEFYDNLLANSYEFSSEYQDVLKKRNKLSWDYIKSSLKLATEFGINQKAMEDYFISQGMGIANSQGELTNYADGFQESLVTINEKIQLLTNQQKQVLDNLGKEYTTVADSATNMFSRIEDKSKYTLDDMKGNLDHNQETVKKWGENIELLAASSIDKGLLEQLRQAGPESAALIQEIVDGGEDGWMELSQKYSDGGEAAVEAFGKSLGLSDDVSQQIAGMVENTSDNLLVAIENSDFKSIGNDVIQGYIDGIEEGMEDANSFGEQIGETTSDGAKSALSENSPSLVFHEIGTNVVEGFILGIEEKMPVLLDAVTFMADGVSTLSGEKWLDPNFTGLSGDAVNTFTDNVNETAPKLSGSMGNMFSTLQNSAKDMLLDPAFTNLSAVSVNEFTKNVDGTAGKFKGSFSSMINSIHGESKSMMLDPSFTGLGSIAVSNMASAVYCNPELINSTITSVNDAQDAAVNAIGDEKFPTVGGNIVNGITQGVNSGRSGLISSMKETVRAAARAAKDEAQIKSPSRLFRKEIGFNIGEGMALGIEDAQEDVVQKMTDTVAALEGTASGVETAIIPQLQSIQTGQMQEVDNENSEKGKLQNLIEKIEMLLAKGVVMHNNINMDGRQLYHSIQKVKLNSGASIMSGGLAYEY